MIHEGDKVVTEAEHSRGEIMDSDQLQRKLRKMSADTKHNGEPITEHDIAQAEDSIEKLVDKIQHRTGERRRSIENWLKQYV